MAINLGRRWAGMAVSPQIGNIAAMADFLPQATRDSFGLK